MNLDENGMDQGLDSVAEDAADLSRALEDERARADKYLSNWQRSEADFDNYRKRMEQERSDNVKYANTTLILNILPVLDDLDRAVKALPKSLEGDPWVEGIKLIHRKMKSILEAQGVTEVDAVGQSFDPCVHEAVARSKGQEGKVIEEVQKGYTFHGRLIRPSCVVVGQGEKQD